MFDDHRQRSPVRLAAKFHMAAALADLNKARLTQDGQYLALEYWLGMG